MEKIEYKKTDRQLIKYKSPSIKKLEKEYEHIQLSFNIKTSYFKYESDFQIKYFGKKPGDVFWSKTYYEVSYFKDDEKHILKFYVKRGYKTLEYYFWRALHTGGDKQND